MNCVAGISYLITHLGTRVYVEAQVVEGQLGGLFLQLPSESNLPVVEYTETYLFRGGLQRNMLHSFRNSTCTHTDTCLFLGMTAQWSFLFLCWVEMHCSELGFKIYNHNHNQIMHNHVCIEFTIFYVNKTNYIILNIHDLKFEAIKAKEFSLCFSSTIISTSRRSEGSFWIYWRIILFV